MKPRISFSLAAASSLALGIWFVAREQNSPGMSFAAAFLVVAFVLALFAAIRSDGDHLAHEVKTAGGLALLTVLLGVAYLAAFFGLWAVVGLGWIACHGPMLWSLASAPPRVLHVARVEEQPAWLLYELRDAEQCIGQFAVYKADGRLEVLTLATSEGGREEAYRSSLVQLFEPWLRRRQFPDQASFEG